MSQETGAPAAMFKLIRRFLFGTFPFFLQFTTAHPSAASGFSENSTTRFRFLFLSGATHLSPGMVNWGVGVSAHAYRGTDVPTVAHPRVKSTPAAAYIRPLLEPILWH